jgi:transcriptional regulator with XRE-family HTH domain
MRSAAKDCRNAHLPSGNCRTGAKELLMSSKDSDATGTPLAVFGAMLRFYRSQAGLSQTDLAARAYVSHDVISKVETGQRVATPELVTALEAVPELNARGAIAELRAQMKEYLKYRANPDWFRDWTRWEAAAKTLRWYEPLLIPGILQTQKYARAVYRTRVGDTDEEIEELVAARLERQAILARPKPPTLWVVIDEGVLHRLVGGAEVMLEQTEHLTEAARRPNIVVQVIPASVGAHEGLRGSFSVADFADAPSVAWQDGALHGQPVEDDNGMAAIAVIWDTLKSEALPRSASLELMQEVGKKWT